MSDKSQAHRVEIEVSVLVGRCQMRIQDLLRLGRGAVIPLDSREEDQLWILAAGHPIARGEITVRGDRLCIAVTEPADASEFDAVA